ncbi:hypothetical protein [Nocardia asiatica]|uniref:hypothetical protein n=1 Tax=Nocardia asiatica TaxID=209252 RepID=UPI003EE2F975
MARIGVISISDGRDYVHAGIADFIASTEDRLVAALTAAGHDVVCGAAPISDNALASSVARAVAAAGVDLTVLHYAVWAFPHFTMLAAGAIPGPLLLLSNMIRCSRGWWACSRQAAHSTRSGASTAGCGATRPVPNSSTPSACAPGPRQRYPDCAARRSGASAAGRWA